MASKAAHSRTLFHLVPTNQVARDALLHPDNQRFVSSSGKGQPGLEVGYHVSSIPRGHVITRLGRNADLTLRHTSPKNAMSAVHVAFEINPDTKLVILSIRSKRVTSVTFAVLKDKQKGPGEERSPEPDAAEETITGDGVLLYGQAYKISIASYGFELHWSEGSTETLKTFTIEEYLRSLQRLQDVQSRDRPTEYDNSEVLSWHISESETARSTAVIQDIPRLRVEKGSGTFGTVYEAVERTRGYPLAVKVVALEKYCDVDAARALIHKEVKILKGLSHIHIIEYLGSQHFDTPRPEIFMPLREGSLTNLVRGRRISNHGQLCLDTLKQMLSALDYLANKELVHRDVKPDNILYYTLPNDGGLRFQLADFGLAHYASLATTSCGTGYYKAPELLPHESGVHAPQSPKMDVWSLFATMVAIDSRFDNFPPRETSDYGTVLHVLQWKATRSRLEPMGRLYPDRRASAAQMLVKLFDGEGLTTPRSQILPIEVVEGNAAPQATTPAAATAIVGPSRQQPQKAEVQGGKTAHPLPGAGAGAGASRPLVVYPPNRGRRRNPLVRGDPAAQQPPTRAQRDGVSKRRAATPSRARANIAAGQRLLQKLDREAPPAALEQRPKSTPRVPGAFVD